MLRKVGQLALILVALVVMSYVLSFISSRCLPYLGLAAPTVIIAACAIDIVGMSILLIALAKAKFMTMYMLALFVALITIFDVFNLLSFGAPTLFIVVAAFPFYVKLLLA